ncbi:MAG: SsrA-binding protein SmpB, partial [Patescibacteria group bacterium]
MKIINRKARFNYELLDRLETGIVLTGSEVKSVKAGHISLAEAYVRLIDGELWLINATISPYKFANNEDYDPIRTRKLLVHKHQILTLTKKMEGKNLTLVPTAIYTSRGRVKLEIALARGRKEFEKREKIKARDMEREKERTLKTINCS